VEQVLDQMRTARPRATDSAVMESSVLMLPALAERLRALRAAQWVAEARVGLQDIAEECARKHQHLPRQCPLPRACNEFPFRLYLERGPIAQLVRAADS
jgi:hypothetical protein